MYAALRRLITPLYPEIEGEMSKAVNCLACCWLGQPVSTWQVEMGWPDIHWLAGDQGEWAGGSRMF
jgi:hypothetical protein